MAIRLSLNNAKALRPSASTQLPVDCFLLTSHWGNEKEYNPSNKPRLADGCYQNIRPAGMRREISRTTVANGDGGILLQQEQRHGLANDIAAAYDNRFFTGNRNPRLLEHMQSAFGRTGNGTIQPTGQAAGVDVVEAIHIFFRKNE